MGAGRKPKPPGEKQGSPVSVYFTEGEREALAQAARGEPLAAYVRRIVLRHLARRRR